MSKSKKVGNGIDISSAVEELRQNVAAGIMGITTRVFRQWLTDGCPKNTNTTVNLKEVIKWRSEKLKKSPANNDKQGADLDKTLKQTEKLELEILKMKKEMIPVAELEETLKKAANELRLFLTDGYKRNGQDLMYKIKEVETLQEFYEIFDEYNKQAMKCFVESGDDIN